MRPTRAVWFSVAAAAGFAAGWLLAGRYVERHRAALFRGNRMQRLAALSFLAGQVRVETVRLLEDYLAWEPSAMLKARGRDILRRMKAELEAAPA